MFHALVSVWFLLTGTPGHINQERFDERIANQKIVRSRPLQALYIHVTTCCPEEAWAVSDVKSVRDYNRILTLGNHARALPVIVALKSHILSDYTEDNLELRRLLVALLEVRDRSKIGCQTVITFLHTGKWWEREADCQFTSFAEMWNLKVPVRDIPKKMEAPK